jgi:hypothetical protein
MRVNRKNNPNRGTHMNENRNWCRFVKTGNGRKNCLFSVIFLIYRGCKEKYVTSHVYILPIDFADCRIFEGLVHCT